MANLNITELRKELESLTLEDIVDRFIDLAQKQVELQTENERLESQAMRDRQIAKSMEWTMNGLQTIIKEVTDTYKGLYDTVKTSLNAGATATEALATLALREPIEQIVYRNEWYDGPCCEDEYDDESDCWTKKCCSKTGKRLPVDLTNDPEDFDEEREDAKLADAMEDLD
jgi:hypothetical protein